MNAVRLILIVVLITAAGDVWARRKDPIKEPAQAAEEQPADTATEAASTSTESKAGDASAAGTSATEASTPNVDAVKAEIAQRKKMSGTLDIYDSKIDKVRTLDVIELKDEKDKVTGQFRDTKSGDVVSVEIKIVDGKPGDFEITGAEPPKLAPVAKKDYTDQELKDFMKEYISTQSAGTGIFQLFDEKAKKMRKLEFVKLQDKIRRYGIIAICTAEFKETDTGNTLLADINVENGKEGLNVTAVRIKSIIKAASTTPSDTSATTPAAGSAATPSETPAK